jgi:hypothetical protein
MGGDNADMTLRPEDIEFVDRGLPQFDGWCHPEAALLTLWLMQYQAKLRYESAAFEIGVYKGKYLSVLYHRAHQTGQRVVGVDTFGWSSPDEVISLFARVFGSSENVSLVREDSMRLAPRRVIEMLGGRRASFISVDGDHAAHAVQSDLKLSKKVLGEGGIVAVDDFLNPRAISVSEGVYRFFLKTGERSLTPFAHCANKLFLAQRQHHDQYAEALEEFVLSMPHLPMVQEFNRQLAAGRAYVEQELLGSKVLIF